MNKELKLIEIIKNSLTDSSYLGDDCAYLRDLRLCVSSDSLVEDVHFSFNTTTAHLLAKKALKVNLSDIYASGAKPLYACVNISGQLSEDFIKEFYTSLNSCAEQFGVKIIGGDLTSGEKLSISICVLGDTTGRNISSRKNAKAGYVIALAGKFGTSAHGLKNLANDKFSDNIYTTAHLDPLLHPEISEIIAKNAKAPYAMMDSSDGLINALEWISKSSATGADISYDLIPKDPDCERSEVLFGGEDYSLVCALSKDDYDCIKCPSLVIAGHISEKAGIRIDCKDIKDEKREEFLHFD